MPVHLKQFSEVPNVGDAIGAPLVEVITGRTVRVVGEAPLAVPNLIAIGSIAHWSDEHSVLWGCGLIAKGISFRPPAKVLALRGKLTRDRFVAQGIDCGDLLGDAGLFLPELIARSVAVHRVGLVPHYVDRNSAFVAECRDAGVRIIDVQGSPRSYVEELTSCHCILSSSLHGVVLAHAYGIASAWVRISNGVHGDGFKFFDYYSSLDLKARDVQTLSPGHDTIDQMMEKCWLPEALPDRSALRNALVERIALLDI
jgi:pyruvyltransferase